MPKNVRETLSAEVVAEVEIMQALDQAFRELEDIETNEDRREELASEIRQALQRYNQLFRQREGAEDFLKGYYDRLDRNFKKDNSD
jgi:biotin-(acetyl-CoA carboxylase) ligase